MGPGTQPLDPPDLGRPLRHGSRQRPVADDLERGQVRRALPGAKQRVDALLRNQAGFYVYVARGTAGGPAHAAPVPVIVVFETPHGVAVTASGLADGDLVVVEGNERLFPMMPIAPAPAARDAREGP